MGEESKTSCLMKTIPILLVQSGCIIPALHIRLCMNCERDTACCCLWDRWCRDPIWAWRLQPHMATQPLCFTELLKYRLIWTTETFQAHCVIVDSGCWWTLSSNYPGRKQTRKTDLTVNRDNWQGPRLAAWSYLTSLQLYSDKIPLPQESSAHSLIHRKAS